MQNDDKLPSIPLLKSIKLNGFFQYLLREKKPWFRDDILFFIINNLIGDFFLPIL